MANKKINELPQYTGNTSGISLVVNDPSETTTYKITKEKLNEGLISGSSQISYTGITNVPSGLISGSSQLPSGLISGSSQVVYSGITGIPSGLVSGSSQVLSGTGIWSGSAQLPSGVVSGSSQITYSGITNIPSGIISGSSQVIYSGITGIPSGIVSGSSQVISLLPNGTVSGSSQVLNGTTIHSGTFFNGISVVSSSSQIIYSGITGIPGGLVSGSSQVDHNLTTNFVANKHIDHTSVVISGTTGLSGGGDITTSRNISLDTTSATFNDGVKSKMNTENVLSGSLQITNFGFATTGSGTIIGNEVISGSLVVTGSVTIVGSITERLVLKIGSGSAAINFDYNSGSIFYLSGSLGNNTFNVQNVPTTAQRSTALTFVIEQGATPYSASAYQFDGVGQTIKWSNGATPSGNANKTDVIGLTAFRSGSSWNILGTLSTFG